MGASASAATTTAATAARSTPLRVQARDAVLAYAVGHATPGDRVVVTVTATSGHSHAVTSTYFTPQP